MADEEGFISLINTNVPKKDDGSHIFSWMCHRNAIFDVAFSGLPALPRFAARVLQMRPRWRRTPALQVRAGGW